ncbi:MAG: hypothetical protein IKN25_01790 [Spirochaetales bacterium]|jgi:hypothetical protein|nr:hypothetical protein [Spirochaetales bacterium]
MKNTQLHILADTAFTLAIIHFMAKHNLKKSAILKKAIAALRWTMEAQTFSKEEYKKDRKPTFDKEHNLFFVITQEESDFLEHCAKVNGYFSKSDFARELITLYMTNVDIMTEEVYLQRLNDEKLIFVKQIINLKKVCQIRLKRFEYYIRSFSEAIRTFYIHTKCLQAYIW